MQDNIPDNLIKQPAQSTGRLSSAYGFRETYQLLNTLRPRQNGRHFPDDILKWIFLNENVWISINISLKFVPRGPINNIPVLVQVMAWRRPGDKPLSEPMIARFPTHICVTLPQWANSFPLDKSSTISQAVFSDAFSWMVGFEFWLKFHCSLFLSVQLTVTQHWFRQWLGAE